MNTNHWKNHITRFLSAQTLSLFGSSIVQYSIIWHITLSTSSGWMLTLATLCGFVPQIAISLFAGIWVDRYDRKKMVMLADTAIAMATLLLAVAFLTGYREDWLLFAVLVVRSMGTGIQNPAVNAIIPQIVPKEHLMKINGIHSTLSSMIVFISPAVSGGILSLFGLETTLFVDVITAILGVWLTSTVQIQPYEKKVTKQNSHLEEIKSGFQYLKANPLLKRILLFQLVILFSISPSAFLTPLMVSRHFGSEVWRLTASEMAYSFGMVLGGLLIASLGGFKKRLNTTILAGFCYGILMIGLGTAPLFWIYLFCNTFIGITSPCYNAPIVATIQEKVSPELHGRIFSFMQISTSCALPLGMTLFGPLADRMDIRTLLIAPGIFVATIAILVYLSSFLKDNSPT